MEMFSLRILEAPSQVKIQGNGHFMLYEDSRGRNLLTSGSFLARNLLGDGNPWSPWVLDSSLQSLPLFSCDILYVCFLIRVPVIGLGPILIQCDLIFNNYACKFYFKIRSHSEIHGRHEFWGHTI